MARFTWTGIVARYQEIIARSRALEMAQKMFGFPTVWHEMATLWAAVAELIAGTSRVVNIKAFGAKGDGVFDDTAAWQAALATNARIFAPDGTYLLSDTIAENLAYVDIEGQNLGGTILQFLPTATGKACLKFNKGLGTPPDNGDVLVGCRLRNLTINAPPASPTLQRIAIDGIDTSALSLENVLIKGFTGGDTTPDVNGMYTTPSCGLRVKGREFGRLKNVQISADRPIWFATNPNYTTLNADHFHAENLYLQPLDPNGPSVFCDPTVLLSTVTFDACAFVGGKYGFFRKDVDGSAARSYQLSFKHVRFEQATAGGYFFFWEGNVSVLGFENCQPASAANGWHVRYAQVLRIDTAVTTNAAGVNLDVDSTVLYACGGGNDWIDNSTVSLGTNTVAFQSPRAALKPLGADFIITQLNPFNALALLAPLLTSPAFAGTATGNLSSTGTIAGSKVIGGTDPGGSFDVRAGSNGIFTSGGVTASGTASTFGSNTAAGQSVIANGAAGNSRGYFFRTAGVNRAFLGINATAEGGSNAGSDVNLTVFDDAGSSLGIAMIVKRATQFITFLRGTAAGVVTVTYSNSMTIDASQGNLASITATNGTAFTINTPTNPATGQRLRVRIRNAAGGALGAATWSANFKMGAAWVQPANGFSRSIDFDYDGTNWVEANRGVTDVAN